MESIPGYDEWKTAEPYSRPMTYAEELAIKRGKLESELPPNVCAAISAYAYSKGHWAGQQEVDQMFCELGDDILAALKKDDLI